MKKLPAIKEIIPVLLLPFFFVYHGYIEFLGLLSAGDALKLLTSFLISSLIIHLVCKWLLGGRAKAALMTVVLMSMNFFFGIFQDLLIHEFKDQLPAQYSFQLSLLGLISLALFFYLLKSKHEFSRLFRFLNILFPLLILADSVTLIIKVRNRSDDPTAGNPVTLLTNKQAADDPDIYFILTDGYSGSRALKQAFNYDNSSFEQKLKERGFYVADSSLSNYNYTIFSAASTLNLDYLKVNNFFDGPTDLPRAFSAMRNNKVVTYLKEQGYAIHNFSIFDIGQHHTPLKQTLLKFDKNLVLGQTLIYRVKKDLGYHLAGIFGDAPRADSSAIYIDLENTLLADSLTRRCAEEKSNQPKFVYTHLLMPHPPYFKDSLGINLPMEQIIDSTYSNKKRYISYLIYSNGRIISLIDHILSKSIRPTIIILLGDHGSRDCLKTQEEQKLQSLNLNAVLLPGRNYNGFYKGISSVNEFRIIFNACFGQKIPLIKDSSVHITVNEALLH